MGEAPRVAFAAVNMEGRIRRWAWRAERESNVEVLRAIFAGAVAGRAIATAIEAWLILPMGLCGGRRKRVEIIRWRRKSSGSLSGDLLNRSLWVEIALDRERT